jgi:hypothetical protein
MLPTLQQRGRIVTILPLKRQLKMTHTISRTATPHSCKASFHSAGQGETPHQLPADIFQASHLSTDSHTELTCKTRACRPTHGIHHSHTDLALGAVGTVTQRLVDHLDEQRRPMVPQVTLAHKPLRVRHNAQPLVLVAQVV